MKYFNLILAILFATQSTMAAVIGDDYVSVGKQGSSANKSVRFGAGSTAVKPQIRYNVSGSQLEFSNNGVDFLGIGSGSGGGSGINLLSEQNLNPDFETGTTSWTNSGGTFASVTTGSSNLLFGKYSAVFTASGASQYVRSSLVTVTYGLANSPCLAQIYYKGGDANLTMKVLDASSNLIASRVLSASTDRTLFGVPFFCGAQGAQYRISVESTAAAAIVALDRTHLGEYGFLGFVDSIPTNVITYTSGSGTYTPTPGTRYFKIKIAGPGGGGSSSGTGSNNAGAAPVADSTFGGVLTAGKGLGGVAPGSAIGGDGGTNTIGAGTHIVLQNLAGSKGGAPGYGGPQAASVTSATGGNGASNPCFGGGGAGNGGGGAGGAAVANSGAGGGGAGPGGTTNSYAGAGGGSGGCIEAIFPNPAASYAYSVGAGAAGGAGGTSGNPGGTGAAGKITIEEYAYASGQAFLPSAGGLQAGDIVSGAWSTCPAGTIAADGTAVARGTYAALFQAISTTYGVGDGSTTFNLPDMRGVFARGQGAQTIGGIVYTGTQGTTQGDQAQGHRHGVGAATGGANSGGVTFAGNTATVTSSDPTSDGTNGTPRVGSETRPANITLKYCIRTIAASAGPVISGPIASMPGATVTGASYSIALSDSIVDFDTTANAITGTLPTAIGNRGKTVRISKVNAGANLLTINTTGGQTIGGVSSTKLHRLGEYIELYSDGANWQWISDSYRSESVIIAGICSGNPCSIGNQQGNWIGATSITRSATGIYPATIVTGIFSATPICTASVYTGGTVNTSNIQATSATAFTMYSYTSSTSAAVDVQFQVNCRGPR